MITQAIGWVALVAIKDEDEADGLAVWTVPPGHGEIENKISLRIAEVPVAFWRESIGKNSGLLYYGGFVSWNDELVSTETIKNFIAYAKEQKMPPLRQWKRAHEMLT
jgi:hypothetical protein